MKFKILGYFSHILHILRQRQPALSVFLARGCHMHLSRLLSVPGPLAGGENGSEIQAAVLVERAPFCS